VAAKARARRHHSPKFKRNAVEAVNAGESIRSVSQRLKLAQSVLSRWCRRYHAEGLDGLYRKNAKRKGKAKAKANGQDPAPDAIEARLTPEALFTSRVNRAIVLLRNAWQEVKRLEGQHKIKGPDKAHSLAYVALLELQGDNGS